MIKYIIAYLVLINLIGLYIMKYDKKRAVQKKYRIPEKKLFLVAILGGSLGTTMGMNRYRHKTKHWYFKWGMPIILVVQVLLAFYIMSLIGYK